MRSRLSQYISRDQVPSPRKSRCWHVQQPRRNALAIRQDHARPIYRDIIDDQHKAGVAVPGLVDRAAERQARIRKINEARDVPGWAIAGCGNIHAARQFGVLIERNARPHAPRWRGDVDRSSPRGAWV